LEGTDTNVEHAFSGTRTAEIVGITYRQLDYWARTDLVRPSVCDANGSGTQRLYSYTDLVELKVIKRLLDADISLQAARKAIEYLRDQLGDDITSANLVISGSTAMLALDDGELIDLVRKGQGVLNILSLDSVRQEVDSSVRQLFPADGPGSQGALASGG
jgi:DNA-binding transcriptional MerR regulator